MPHHLQHRPRATFSSYIRRKPWKTWFKQSVSSIYKLPLEVLALIFVLGAQDDIMLPVYVSHVCRRWRALALETPRLWTHIWLDHRGEMWKERLQRAKACSLNMRLTDGRKHLDCNAVQWYMYGAVSTNSVRHWRSLEISFSQYSPYLWNAALSEFCGRGSRFRAHRLEELKLVYPRNDDAKEFCLFSGFAPRLRRATVDGIRLSWLPSMFQNLNFLCYTHHGFTNGSVAVYEVLSILRTSSRLVELEISFPRRNVHPMPPPLALPPLRRASLPHLRKLRLCVESNDIPSELVQLMTLVDAPGVKSLQFIDLTHRQRAFPSLSTFLQVYSIPVAVQTVVIEHGWCGDFTPMLKGLPNLQQIVVKHHPRLPDGVFNVWISDL
ncbi:hypothetical protein C8J56DRAFT_813967 [Mycena floridula]|nr:hypothetical protein C8J56DRAFT_813967 [Mycena floridula]